MPRLSGALALLVLVACQKSAPPPTTSRDVNVGTVKNPGVVVTPNKPACGPDTSSATLETEQAFGRPIRALCIRGVGDDRREEVRKYLHHATLGEKLNDTGLELDIQNLFESGLFRHIDVLARTEGDGIELTYDLEARPIIRAVDVQGPVPPDNDLQTMVGTVYSPSNVASHAKTLGEGYDLEHSVSTQADGVRVRVIVKKR